MESLLEQLQHEPLPYTCYPFTTQEALGKYKVTFARWRVVFPPAPVAVWVATEPPPMPETAKTALGWRVTVERPPAPPEELIFYTDAELAWWWEHDGAFVPMYPHPMASWMAGRMVNAITRGFAPDVLNDEILVDDLRLIEGALKRFYKRVRGRLIEQRATQKG